MLWMYESCVYRFKCVDLMIRLVRNNRGNVWIDLAVHLMMFAVLHFGMCTFERNSNTPGNNIRIFGCLYDIRWWSNRNTNFELTFFCVVHDFNSVDGYQVYIWYTSIIRRSDILCECLFAQNYHNHNRCWLNNNDIWEDNYIIESIRLVSFVWRTLIYYEFWEVACNLCSNWCVLNRQHELSWLYFDHFRILITYIIPC